MANETGSNYWFIPGGETPAPPVAPPVQEPVSPFPTVNYLQDPVQLLMNPGGGPAPVSGPSFTPQAAPTAMRLDQPQTIFGPVTPSGYAIPPVDPLSYYAEPAAPVDQPTVQPPVSEPISEEVGDATLPDWWTNLYVNTGTGPIWSPETNKPSQPPTTTVPIETGGGEPIVTPPRERLILPPESVTTTPVPQPPVTSQPPITEPEPLLPEVVTINRPTFPIYEPAPSRGPVTIPGTSVSSTPVLRPVEQVSQVAPTTIPVPTRQDMGFAPGRFDYINYDPEEILAAAMRAMGNSRIRQSITDEAVQNRMFSRMR